MTEEPRRSGRATKGQHTKNVEEPEPAQPKPTKPKKKGSKKSTSEQEEEDDIIRCVCGHQEDDGGRTMICCENCGAWQHNDCMGLPEDSELCPAEYFCEQCKPGDHKELLAAMKRGVKLWEERQLKAEELRRAVDEKNPKKKGKGKGARQSQGAETKPEPVESTEGTNGRSQSAGNRKSDGVEETNARKRKTSTAAPTSRKASKPTVDAHALTDSIAEMSDERRKRVAESLFKTFADSIRDLAKKGKYRIPDGQTAQSLGEHFALHVEYSMFINLCPEPPDLGTAYPQQARALRHNVPRNPSLVLGVLDESITPDELSKMSSDDMANEELQQQMATMKEEAEKQSILVQESGPRIRRTHKGEEFVDDQSQQMTSDSVISAPPPPRRRDTDLEEPFSPRGDADVKGERTSATPLQVDTSRPSPQTSKEHRSSSQFNIQSVWTSVQSPDTEHMPRRQNSGFSPVQPTAPRPKDDADIDRLLNEEDDSAPYSPAELGTDSTIVWHGEVDMPINPGTSIAKFKAFATHVAGSDLSTRLSTISSIFPPKVTMDGRIDITRADDYLSSLSSARSTDVAVFSITPSGSEEAVGAEFDKLYNYLVERRRFGVVGAACYRESVRDIYIVPVEAGMSDMPVFLQRLDHNIIEQPRPRKLLLLVFVLRWDVGAGATQAGAGQATTSTLSPPGQGSAMSPVAPQSSTPSQFPSNPYAPGPPHNIAPNQQLAAQILGPFYNCPTAQRLLGVQEVPEDSLRNLKTVFEKFPETRDDFASFTRHLQETPT